MVMKNKNYVFYSTLSHFFFSVMHSFEILTTWSLLMEAVPPLSPLELACGSTARGLIPDHALRTSLLRTGNTIYLLASSTNHWISSSVGRGRKEGDGQATSVVPTKVFPSQGRKNKKRPSEVAMSTKPLCHVKKAD